MARGGSASAIAVKRLSAVEVDPDRSHQHEFHAGRLRTALGLPDVRTSGTLSVAYFDDDAEPLLEDGRYTLIDVRRDKPRSPEYRMYYNASVIDDAAAPGDLLVVSRDGDSTDLRAIVVRAGTRAEGELLDALFVRNQPVLERFMAVQAPVPSADRGERLFETLSAAVASPDLADHPVAREAIGRGALPDTRTMAAAGREIALSQTSEADPDAFISAALNGETSLFNHISDALGRLRLRELIDREASLDEFQAMFMRMAQSAKSRRGLSLQHHFASILLAGGIEFSPQCETEEGETADFMMPGCSEYHDPGFESHRLRMVACKSTARDRWRQVLNEAARIPEKYFLTLDPDLSARLISKIAAANLRLFLPRSVIDERYRDQTAVGSVGDLLSALRDAMVA